MNEYRTLVRNVTSIQLVGGRVFQGVEDRDKQIVMLEKKLSDAVGDMENNMTLMDDVRAEIHKGM